VQNDISTAVMWSKSKPDVEFQYGGRLGEFNDMSSQSHMPLCKFAGCNNSIGHIEIVFRHILFIFVFSAV